LVLAGAVAVVVVGFGIQLVPYGRAHSNPPVTGEPAWDSPRTEELVRRACFDCHSNETVWPWYSNVAPMSWVLTLHIDDGRDELNFSEWGVRRNDAATEAAETVRDGEMPTWDYALAHPEARLSASEKRELIDGLVATFGDEKKKEDEEDR
jgi:cytochrome c551/c552